MKEEKGEVVIFYLVINGFFRTEGKFFIRFKDEVGKGGNYFVQEGEIVGGQAGLGLFGSVGRGREGRVFAEVIGEGGGSGHSGFIFGNFVLSKDNHRK